MPERTESIAITINGAAFAVAPETTAAVAMAIAGARCRTSVSGEARAAFCGMGICFECRVQVNGQPHQRACQIVCAPGMRIATDV